MIGGPRPVCVNANIWATTWSTRMQREGGGVYLTSSSITFPREIRIASTSNRTWNTYSPYNIIIIYNYIREFFRNLFNFFYSHLLAGEEDYVCSSLEKEEG